LAARATRYSLIDFPTRAAGSRERQIFHVRAPAEQHAFRRPGERRRVAFSRTGEVRAHCRGHPA
jgi:hypothetical protein